MEGHATAREVGGVRLIDERLVEVEHHDERRTIEGCLVEPALGVPSTNGGERIGVGRVDGEGWVGAHRVPHQVLDLDHRGPRQARL